MYCDYSVQPAAFKRLMGLARLNAFVHVQSGICKRNKPDCGQFGKGCCVREAALQELTCGKAAGKGSKQGYCADFLGKPWYYGQRPNGYACTPCPETLEERQTGRYDKVHLYKSCGFDMWGNKGNSTDMLAT